MSKTKLTGSWRLDRRRSGFCFHVFHLYLLLPFAFIYFFIQLCSPFELKDAKSFLRTRATWREQKLVSLLFISSSDQRLVSLIHLNASAVKMEKSNSESVP